MTEPRVIGMLMIRDEEDMLAESLANHIRFCGSIFVLDGTQGDGQRASKEFCMSCPQIAGYWTDNETGLPIPLRDGARQFLLERARSKFGAGNWYAILHGDEIWGQDPRPFLDKGPPGCDGIAVQFYHFFPHVSQRESWNFGPGISIESLATWYMTPPVKERRLFWDSGEFDFPMEGHSLTIPPNLQVWQSEVVVKQYNYRTPEQARKRAAQRREDNWQRCHYEHLLNGGDFFVETLDLPGMRWASSVPPGEGKATNVMRNPLPVWR